MSIAAFIFDLDGIITDSAEYHFLAWKELADELGIEIDREFNEQLKGVDRMTSLERILNHGGMADKFTPEKKIEIATRKNDHYKTLIQQVTPKDILPGIQTLLDDLNAAGIPMALASASKNAPFIIERLGLQDYFANIVDPATLKANKPDPEIFVRGAEMLGVEAAQCVGVEDAEAGVESIQAAGMFAVGVGDANALAKADLLLSDTAQLSLSEIVKAFEDK
ncbi:beta-phosphoglucomutase [Vibrio sp. JC009]|uniref:beta-phosphoglucomutase n=1 Tax=Vibrio sp. JC009 TaxID=2912314 RepID=UPI0023B040E9|nr:beta-phosphoglucomutase [Vibrio sp. JC009]WED24818.1 beta-phosphoglucomutase [Vibrio sp. JC009]